MRRWKRGNPWKRRAAAVLAVLFLVVRIGSISAEEILQDAVCTISPMVGYVMDMEEKAMPGQIEQLLLAEQSGQSGQSGQSEQPGQSGQPDGEVSLFPEDEDEVMEAITEWDADLLEEIDRENEAMLLLAEQQAQAALNQSQQSSDQNQAGQSSVGNGQENIGEDSTQTAAQVLALPYSMEQLSSLDFLVTNLYNVNKTTRVSAGLLDSSAMLAQNMKLQSPDSGGPKILIHHTHATEYFADSDEKNEATLIVGVGDYLEELLETRYGIEVLHDRTVYPYNEAYSQALKNVEKILAENPTIEVFIDLHRDAGGTKKYTVNVDGKETANLMFFNGLSHNVNGPIDYLINDNLEENLAFSFQLKMAGDSLYPGLCKRNYLKAYRYNLHVLPRAVIVEVGDNNNTLQEAKNAMEPLARILNYVLTGEY